MKKLVAVAYILFYTISIPAQNLATVFEKSTGTHTATYFETIAYYRMLAKNFSTISIKEMGETDAGYPLHLVLFSPQKTFDPVKWRQENKIIIMINNGIHPGEPDGIDATMMLLRDLALDKIKAPSNVVLAIIPIYNIGGALNRNTTTRVNQNGPVSYGFRGNAQNLDLNRDFTKCDSKNSRSFARIFHYLQPHILLDNHVSDGADFQHTMTLLTTQHNKLGGSVGRFLHQKLEPALYQNMEQKNWTMIPYVDFGATTPEKGWKAFNDAPRYASGYAALFNTIGFVPETHMLKPYPQRVQSTFDFMQATIEEASRLAKPLLEAKRAADKEMMERKTFALSWQTDSTRLDTVSFMGYEAGYRKSKVTGEQVLYYDRSRPFTKPVKFYNHFLPKTTADAPRAYIIPQGWHKVIDILKLNNVQLQRLKKDTILQVQAGRIEAYQSMPRAYEGHHKNYNTTVNWITRQQQFLKGDYLISTNQPARRYLVEMLEPEGDDSFFSWNFFDAILQQKEGYSNYRWEEVAAGLLENDPSLRAKLEEQKKVDPKLAASASAQLYFIYTHSPYYEAAHLQYPVYRAL